ncbi:MAG: histidinol-phosphatase HisJ family protein [Ruminococcus sp.]|jgi:histidinol-phosphatase (PHP family)
MIPDYHLHTFFSGDSEADPHDMADQAISLGMKSICFTDHMDTDSEEPEFILDTNRYIPYMEALREEYEDRLDIRIGVEIGMQPHLAERHDVYVHDYPFDFVIGSLHLVYGKDPYFSEVFEGREDREVYRAYLESLLENIRAFKGYQVVGHIDYVVRYGVHKAEQYGYTEYADILDAILSCIIEDGRGIEVNTAGLQKGLGFPNPHYDVIRRYRELGGTIVTVGSDAHNPSGIGYDFRQIGDFLKEAGFRYRTEFKGNVPVFIQL